jgi:hypothetical protein
LAHGGAGDGVALRRDIGDAQADQTLLRPNTRNPIWPECIEAWLDAAWRLLLATFSFH